MKDFFVSYNSADRQWAEWIAWQLEEAGYTTVLQAWDFLPGSNFVLEMQRAASEAERTIAVLSPDYLGARFTHPEWAAAFRQDPTGEKGTLLPVRVQECDLEGLLPQIIYVDLVGLDEAATKEALLTGVRRERAKPAVAPSFPGAIPRSVPEQPRFPGALPMAAAPSGQQRCGYYAEYGPMLKFALVLSVSFLVIGGILVAVVDMMSPASFIITMLRRKTPAPPSQIVATQEPSPTLEESTALALVPTDTSYPTYTPYPTHTSLPTDTHTSAPTPTPIILTVTPTPEPAAGATMVWEKDESEMVYVPAGEFIMGFSQSDAEAIRAINPRAEFGIEGEKPQHRVFLDAFYIDRYEVTNAQYRKCVGAGECNLPSDTTYYGRDNYAQHPVVFVSWYDADTYCQWASKRLPTEAEWEKAARGDKEYTWPWGNTFDRNRVNFCDTNCPERWKHVSVNDGYAHTAPVGNYLTGASPYGALDMAGNVWEWVADWYDPDYYSQSPAQNPPGPDSGFEKVVRGGSWLNGFTDIRARYRYKSAPTLQGKDFGFRCAR